MTTTYHFGVDGVMIWIFHILIGLFLLYLGMKMVNKEPVAINYGVTLAIIGALTALYHGHIWFYESKNHS
jgi:hypothetical protein